MQTQAVTWRKALWVSQMCQENSFVFLECLRLLKKKGGGGPEEPVTVTAESSFWFCHLPSPGCHLSVYFEGCLAKKEIIKPITEEVKGPGKHHPLSFYLTFKHFWEAFPTDVPQPSWHHCHGCSRYTLSQEHPCVFSYFRYQQYLSWILCTRNDFSPH